MFSKPKAWLAVSLLCLLGAGIFWQLGRREMARRRPPVATPPAVAVPSAATRPAALLSTAPTGIQYLASPRFKEPVKSPVPWRLRNTDEPLDTLARRENTLLLANALIDLGRSVELAIPESLRLKEETSTYLVQSKSKVDDDFRSLLGRVGARIVSYVPNNAFLVRMPASRTTELSGSPGVRSVLPWEPYFKLSPGLLASVMESKPVPDDATVRMLVYSGEEAVFTDELRSLGLEPKVRSRSPFGTQFIVPIQGGSLTALAQLDRVQWIEPAGKAALLNDLAGLRLGTSTNNGPDTQYLGLTGKGVTVNVNDTGVDAGHPDLSVHPNSIAVVDDDGHGTHVAGIIASSGASFSPSGTNGIPGSATNAHFHGKAPEAQILALPFDTYLGSLMPEEDIRLTIVSNGVHISNNSWGYPAANYYDSAAASYDEAVRDALPTTPGAQPIAFVFSAGNAGQGSSDGTGGVEGSVISPGTAKNVITVGAIESLRLITNGPVTTNIFGEPSTNRFFYTDTDSDNQVADYSSRGNVGVGVEGEFGRFKPDVVAPGSYIISTRASGFTDPGYVVNFIPQIIRGNTVDAHATNNFTAQVPDETIRISIRLAPNSASPRPFPGLVIGATKTPPPAPPTFFGTNSIRLDESGAADWYFSVVNPTDQPVSYDLLAYVSVTNSTLPPDFFIARKEINDPLAPNYRYESGTSMAAPAISGMLALIQEFFTNRLALPIPTPALFKAMLINGTKNVSSSYQRASRTTLNDQGWGLPYLEQILPGAMDGNRTDPDSWPVRFFDQDPKRALATGEQLTWTMSFDTNSATAYEASSSPMTVTLVWTDPPGNPAVGIKLVNDLDLIVTNLTTKEIYWGNNITDNGVFNAVTDPSESNRVSDVVNNVENVFISGGLGAEYAITVRANRVNVDTLPGHATGVVQDFALVIGLGNTKLTNVFKVTPPAVAQSNFLAEVNVLTNGAPLFDQRVSANPPLSATTNGELRQWRFYTFVNDEAKNTNVAFILLPNGNVSTPRLDEPDLDLYVSDNPAITNLDPAVLSAAIAAGQISTDRRNGASRTRGGSEFVAWDNSPPNGTYYVAVKSEDQKAADFAVLAIATDIPFDQQNPDGSRTVTLVNAGRTTPLPLPDGANASPGSILSVRPALFIGLSTKRTTLRNVAMNLDMRHENFGDVTALVTSPSRITATVFAHTFNPGVAGDVFVTNRFNDNPTNSLLKELRSEGPIQLDQLGGQSGQGVWQLKMIDDGLTQTGAVAFASLNLYPQDPDCFTEQGCDIVLEANGWYYDWIEVPADAISLSVCISSNSQPVGIYLNRGVTRPSDTSATAFEIVNPPDGGCLTLDEFSSPILEPGLYRLGIQNRSAVAQKVHLRILIRRGSLADRTFSYVATNVPVTLNNDALSLAGIDVPEDRRIVDLRVGLRLDHPRVSDLSIHLVSPQGSRWLLAENRGGSSIDGYGATFNVPPAGAPPEQVLTNYSWVTFSDNTNFTDSYLKFSAPPFRSPSLTPNPVFFDDDFDTYSLGVKPEITGFGPWTVLALSSAIIPDPQSGTTHSNVLALSHGTVATSLKAKDQRLYSMEFAYRNQSSANTQEITFDVGPVTYTNYQVGDHLLGTIAPAVAAPKVRLTPGQEIQVTVPSDEKVTVDTAFAVEVNAQGDVLLPAFRGLPRYSLVGQWAHSSSLLSTQTAWGLPFLVGTNALLRAPAEPGDYFLWLAINDPSYLDNSGSFPVTVQWKQTQLSQLDFVLGGTSYSLFPGDDWQVFRTRFTGREEPMEASFSSSWNTTVLIDAVKITEPIASVYYASEEPLPSTIRYNAQSLGQPLVEQSSIKGEIARGTWRLEVTDTRAVAASVPGDGELLAWYLQVVFGPRQRPLALTNGVNYAFNLRSTGVRYFEVNVPAEARNITNVITSLDGLPYSVYFNANNLPDLATDGVPPGFVLPVGPAGPGVVAPGSKYFLAVVNDDLTAPFQGINARVDFQLPMVSLTNNVPFTLYGRNLAGITNRFPLTAAFQNRSNILHPGTNIQWYKYDVLPSPTLHAVTFTMFSTNRDLRLVARRSLAEAEYLPTPTLYDYHSINADIGTNFIIVRSNSFPVPLTAVPWLLGVYNAGTNDGTYSLYATRFTNNPPALNLVPSFTVITNWNLVTNEVGFELPPGERLNYFHRFQSDPTNRAMLFELLSLNGDADLTVRRNDLPSTSIFDFSDLQTGTNSERVVLATNLFLPSFGAPTNWYINVLNHDITTVTGLLRVAFARSTNFLTSGLPFLLSSAVKPSGGTVVTWRGMPGALYQVNASTNSAGPFDTVLGTVQAVSSTVHYTDSTPPAARFYQVEQLSSP